MDKEKSCCSGRKINNKKGILAGFIYGVIPHTFCIAYIMFSILGATIGIAFFRKFFFIPYFFQILIILSFVFATISAGFYLRKNSALSISGIKNKWKYLATLYITVISVNLLFFFVIFPAMANISSNVPNQEKSVSQLSLSSLILKVEIPCSGHAPLIIDELKKVDGVEDIKFENPNIFNIKYDKNKASALEIKSLDIFKTYKAISL